MDNSDKGILQAVGCLTVGALTLFGSAVFIIAAAIKWVLS